MFLLKYEPNTQIVDFGTSVDLMSSGKIDDARMFIAQTIEDSDPNQKLFAKNHAAVAGPVEIRDHADNAVAGLFVEAAGAGIVCAPAGFHPDALASALAGVLLRAGLQGPARAHSLCPRMNADPVKIPGAGRQRGLAETNKSAHHAVYLQREERVVTVLQASVHEFQGDANFLRVERAANGEHFSRGRTISGAQSSDQHRAHSSWRWTNSRQVQPASMTAR